MVDSSANERLRALEASQVEGLQTRLKQATQAAAGIQLVIGVGMVALGILALALVAMLTIGPVNFVTGATISGRMAGILK